MSEKSWTSMLRRKDKRVSRIKILGLVSLFFWVLAIGMGAYFALMGKKAAEGKEHAEAAAKDSSENPFAMMSEETHEVADSSVAEEAVTTPTREEIAALRELAEIHSGNGHLEKAVAPIEKILKYSSQDTTVLIIATRVYLGTARYRQALDAARTGLERIPGHREMKAAAIMAQFRLGQVEQAFQEAETAVKAQPKDLVFLTTLGTMEVEVGPGQHGNGKALDSALKIRPDYTPALYQLGRKYQLEGNYRDAETAFRKVLKDDGKHAKARGQLGSALYHLHREAEALREFEAALALSPRDYNTWFNLGELQLGRAAAAKGVAKIQAARARAMEAYLQAVEINPMHAQAHYRIGVLMNGNSQYKEAIRHLEVSLKIDARHVPTLVQLSLSYEKLKLLDRAKAYLTRAYELDPLNKAIIFKLKQLS
jgi:tetratricopeptide (TPR) repeat protein